MRADKDEYTLSQDEMIEIAEELERAEKLDAKIDDLKVEIKDLELLNEELIESIYQEREIYNDITENLNQEIDMKDKKINNKNIKIENLNDKINNINKQLSNKKDIIKRKDNQINYLEEEISKIRFDNKIKNGMYFIGGVTLGVILN